MAKTAIAATVPMPLKYTVIFLFELELIIVMNFSIVWLTIGVFNYLKYVLTLNNYTLPAIVQAVCCAESQYKVYVLVFDITFLQGLRRAVDNV